MKFNGFALIMLVFLLCISSAGCNSEEKNTADAATSAYTDDTSVFCESSAVKTGGWTVAEDGSVTDEHREMFSKALEQYTGASYIPLKLLATQVVSGMNYKFLCEEILITSPSSDPESTIGTAEKYVTIYRNLKGECSVLCVEDVGTAY